MSLTRMINAVRYGYNANGSMTLRIDGAGVQQALAWDSRNRLVQATGVIVKRKVTYLIDEK
jgi:YD repeat-containing protein